jgi:hypothetical protein
MKKYYFYGNENANTKDLNFGLTPRDYYDLLSDIWSKDTCAPRLRDNWTKENKTLGQCSITAFLMQDIFGGKVYGIKLKDGNFHCFNVLSDCTFDLTSEQFDEKLDYNDAYEQDRNVHFEKIEKKNRYLYLKEEVLKRLNRR